jgi:hypothetical protein
MCHGIIAKDIADRPDTWMVICAKNGDQKAFVTLLEQWLAGSLENGPAYYTESR